jgi:VWFA-related protein
MRYLLIATVAGIALLAQKPPPITVNTHLVEVDVVVRDDHGPVAGLTQDDFSIFDGGRRQKIAVFSAEPPSAHQTRVPPDPPGTVSNRASGSGSTVILFDMLNTADEDAGKPSAPQAFGRLELLKYLYTLEAGNNESFALFTLFKGLRVLQDFTTDPQAILRAAGRLTPEHSFDQGAEDLGAELLLNAPDLQDPIANNMYKNSVKEMQDYSRRNRAFLTVAALESISRHLQAMPGRKKLIWLSAGFPATTFDVRSRNGQPAIETQVFGDAIARAVRALNDANIAVYPIDPRDPYNAGLAADGIDTLNLVAGGTGGKAFYSLTDLADAIRQSVNDTEITYTLGFYPSDLKPDGSYHSISVQVGRRGVEVRARKGYFAPDQKPMSAKQIQQQFSEVVTSPINATGLSLKARAVSVKPGVYDLEITVDPQELHLEREKNAWVALLDLVAFVPQAPKPNAHQDAIKMTLTDLRLREVLTAGRYTLRRSLQFDLKKPAEMRVAVQDRVTGAAGSVLLHLGPN